MHSKLMLMFAFLSTLHAEAIAPGTIDYFQLSTFANQTSTVQLTVGTDGILNDSTDAIFTHRISDHSLEGQMIDGDIPIYTWNTWGFQSRGGFSSSNTETLSQYQTGRLKEQIGILYQLFKHSSDAIVCLQELQQNNPNARSAMITGLSSFNIEAEYVTNTGAQSFGQVILYRKDRYKPVKAFKPSKPDKYSTGAAGRFKSTVDPRQNDRALKVYFEELTGKKRQLSVVNVHLAYQSPNFIGVIDELIVYSQGISTPKPLAVITGDFNHTIKLYNPTNPKVSVTQVGKSVVWSTSTNTPNIKQTKDNVDGFIIVQP